MNTNESPRDLEQENPDEPAVPHPESPRTEPVSTALPATDPFATTPVPDPASDPAPAIAPEEPRTGPRVSTIVWGLLIMALAGLLIVAKLGLVALDGTYVLIGLMVGTGAALVIGGLVAATARKSPAGRGCDQHRTSGNGSGTA